MIKHKTLCIYAITIQVFLMQTIFLYSQQGEEAMNCRKWFQKVDSTLPYLPEEEDSEQDSSKLTEEEIINAVNKSLTGNDYKYSAQLTEKEIFEAIECLLKCEGNKNPARFSGAITSYISEILPEASTDIAALFYISVLFTGKWDHGDGVALWDREGVINPNDSVQKAYASYRKWFKKIKAHGLDEARRQKLDPLEKTNLHWYAK